ncbi:MAG: nucleotide exchange factor GrpE [Nitrospinae bacterium]|nr:nucleotide exchange factor GrpE [Nitrospinota bacterium]
MSNNSGSGNGYVEDLVTKEKEIEAIEAIETKKEEDEGIEPRADTVTANGLGKEGIGRDVEIVEISDEDRIIKLEKELEEKKKEAEYNFDRLIRLQAEFENYKKRILKERLELRTSANNNLIKELLPVIDNLERAVKSAKDDKIFDSLKEGVEMTLKQFIGVLEKVGLKEITSIGDIFDPTRHEALLMIESDEHEKDTIVEEHQKGYLLNNSVLRPSKVVVAKNKNKRQKEEYKDE